MATAEGFLREAASEVGYRSSLSHPRETMEGWRPNRYRP